MNTRIIGVEPPDHAHITAWIQALSIKYGERIKVYEIGRSLLDRRICAFHIGSRRRNVLYCGGVHGREWITSLLLMYFAEELLDAYAGGGRISDIDVCKLLDSGGVTVIPVLNPDGVEISIHCGNGKEMNKYLSEDMMDEIPVDKLRADREFCGRWKSNARGVDINRNFDAGWDDMRCIAMENGICGPSSEGWTGEYPMSEPETRAVVELCERERFRHLIAFHSQGEEIYWTYRHFTPAKSHIMARILAMSSGYSLSEPSKTASSAGLKDWFMEKYNAPAFTVEVGSGRCPIPLGGFRFMYNRLKEMLVLGIAM